MIEGSANSSERYSMWGTAIAIFDPEKVSAVEIAATIEEKLGYRAEVVDDADSDE